MDAIEIRRERKNGDAAGVVGIPQFYWLRSCFISSSPFHFFDIEMAAGVDFQLIEHRLNRRCKVASACSKKSFALWLRMTDQVPESFTTYAAACPMTRLDLPESPIDPFAVE